MKSLFKHWWESVHWRTAQWLERLQAPCEVTAQPLQRSPTAKLTDEWYRRKGELKRTDPEQFEKEFAQAQQEWKVWAQRVIPIGYLERDPLNAREQVAEWPSIGAAGTEEKNGG
jgi:hypothetical protein